MQALYARLRGFELAGWDVSLAESGSTGKPAAGAALDQLDRDASFAMRGVIGFVKRSSRL